ncbi:Arginine-binding extracellular protein ArtP precursor [Aquimixticola soesokkakensis]|uniref:Arginine-binding extracellular protein ArtP n=1 Tax=Aquimixticola soesokkakensis TaxID=1519096 RepID=A0A1Y5RVM2_9RHOB|nr:transporter substrate-binding domain-containing protein [Aquimixticola soesokkakensis]SLN26473.1 Arginine-binding extracellular protein ArtP precursor [Aquimixticola soesokkakensis]
MKNVTKSIICALALLAAPAAMAQSHDSAAPLKAAYDGGFAPFVFTGDDGNTTGFTYDLSIALAAQMGRPAFEPVDTPFSSIFAGLQADRYELIVAPVNGTEARAETMLFSEPYLSTESSVLTRKGEGVGSLEELTGKVIAVNNGSGADKEATEWAEEYGFSVERYNSQPDALRAVMSGRAYGTMADASASRYVAAQTPAVEVAFTIPVGLNVSFFFRKDDVAFRDEVELALECLKSDGTFAQIFEKWFGVLPPEGSASATIYPGFGAPGFEGYDETPHELTCG